jgi:uncharacterized surface protein with fasciclin (FAS1) repeats
MKPEFCLKSFVMGLLGMAVFTSCHKNNDMGTLGASYTPLQNYISSDTSLTTFNAAIQRANDKTLYAGSDSVTVLIPTNTAFASQGITVSSINNMSPGAVDSLLRYHFINSSANLSNGSYHSYTTQLGPAIYGYGGVTDSNYFNGARASRQPAIAGSKATVYKLNSPLGIPAGSTAQLLASDTSLSYFAEAVKHSGIDLSAKNSNGNTILAPTNTAFRAAGFPTIASIDNKDSVALKNMLLYHVLPNPYFTNSFIGMSTVATNSEGHNITVGLNNGIVQFTGPGNTNPVTITNANRIASPNSVVQTVNGLLAP